MNHATDLAGRGRLAYDRRIWSEAYAHLSAAAARSALDPADLDRLATAAYLVGREDEGEAVSARAYRAWLACGQQEPAIRRAFWLGVQLQLRGEPVRGGAWIARVDDLVGDGDGPARGYLLVLDGLRLLEEGDGEAAHAAFTQVGDIGERTDDPDLRTFGQLGQGQGLIEQGNIGAGMERLDRAMVAVSADEVSPLAAGLVYCAVIEACQETFDLRRAREWTVALTRWCNAQPGLVPYRGQCLVHRAEVMQMQGELSQALEEVRSACTVLGEQPAAGEAFYRLAELHRLRGDLTEAERGYQQASRWMADPQPGLALLRLAQDRADAAGAATRRALGQARGPIDRARLLCGHVEIMLAIGDLPAARDGADELRDIVGVVGAPFLRAVAAQAEGACLVAEGDAEAALGCLRRAWAAWQDLDVPYEAARVRVLAAKAHRLLGDVESAEMELEAAYWVFDQLAARTDLQQVRTLSSRIGSRAAGPLTAREVDVLRLVATGRTNRAIAADLFLSEKTVARHLSNIFHKLGVASRAAATAYAYEHRLTEGHVSA